MPYVGIRAETVANTPNSSVAPITSRSRGFSRRAASSAPPSEPIAMIEPSRPYSPEPLWNCAVAMIAVVIWKFRPNVPTMQTIAMISTMSGRPRT
ncbi:hypothetical protein GCM10025868_16220 [Angustibacter aerolatus]|uniref:Uncharacterized protein n=1 Tax=Angustibacter aerolatus TaxID=1162965 RepID=A0ABQ6JHK8_9ACTN|nr:hypothetical protein GCM10025868_16220 [Angustibacter aerolatus]